MHYHVGIVRQSVNAEDAEIARLLSHAFQQQDAPMMEAMQEMLGVDELLRRPPVLINIDMGPVGIKRVLDELLTHEGGSRDAGR